MEQANPAAYRRLRDSEARKPPSCMTHAMERSPGMPTTDTNAQRDETARRNAAAALQRALDRRDNGGATGHGR